MTSQDTKGVEISHIDSEAICTEVGERLRQALPADPTRLPPDILSLTKRLDGVGRGATPIQELD
jgi:hypothetical protein